MTRVTALIVSAAVCLLGAVFAARVPGVVHAQAQRVDFARDVQPIFRQHCYGCHGTTQQMNGFRLDRRRDAMRGGTIAMIGPGNSEGSRLYQRLIGNAYGTQMPPTGALEPEQIAIIKAWIDQGAEWPDELSGDVMPTTPDPRATRLMDALRAGNLRAFRAAAAADAGAVNLKGAGGSTPLMYAVLYGDAASVRLLLDRGADPNTRNDAGATALMWAVGDLETTRLLLDRGADVNARSGDGRTPLFIASGLPRRGAGGQAAARSRRQYRGDRAGALRPHDAARRGGLHRRRGGLPAARRPWGRPEGGRPDCARPLAPLAVPRRAPTCC